VTTQVAERCGVGIRTAAPSACTALAKAGNGSDGPSRLSHTLMDMGRPLAFGDHQRGDIWNVPSKGSILGRTAL